MKKCLSVCLSALLVLSALAGALTGLTLAASAEEEISGVQTIEFARNGVGGSPYMSGLNTPVGYVFNVDPEKRLLQISIPEFATYNDNTNNVFKS